MVMKSSQNNKENFLQKTFLGIDYGSHHVGFAIKHASTAIAVPFGEYTRRDASFQSLTEYILKIISENEVKGIVVGMPFSLSGAPTAQTAETLAFFEYLEKNCHCPVFSSDERMTSVATNGAHDKSAALILQGFIDRFFISTSSPFISTSSP